MFRDPSVLFQEGMQHFEARQYQQYYVIMRALSDRYPSMHDVCCVIVILDLV
jgi:N-acetyl-anhydromuramyl-L-alanine amidase AmpD